MEQNIKLTTKKYGMNFEMNHDSALVNYPNIYRRLIEKLLCLTLITYYEQHLN